MRSRDSWQTPDELFQELDKEFNFDIDLCATEDNAKLERYYKDYLNNSFYKREYPDMAFMGYDRNIEYNSKIYASLTCFMNPPYSNPRPFIEKAWEDSKHCKIVCLVKCDPSTNWWSTFWNYTAISHSAGPKPGCQVRFFPKRIKFDPPQQWIDSGIVKKVGNIWYQLVTISRGDGPDTHDWEKLSAPTFPSALIIMDRRYD